MKKAAKPATTMPPSFWADIGPFGGLFRFPQVQEHDDEEEQDHDGPGINDHLDGGDELGVGSR